MKKKIRVEHPPKKPQGEIRLQKILADAGFGSRRACEELIRDGRIQVDDDVVTQVGVKVDPAKHTVFVDGQRIKSEQKRYFVINKPAGVLSTSRDPAGRIRVVDLIQSNQRVYNVGRLDKSSEGLLVVTNDGELANRLTHPRYGVHKTYLVQVAGVPETRDLRQLQRGIYLAEGFAKVENIRLKKTIKNGAELEIVLKEGRNREIRRLLARIGHKVLKLKRVAIGAFRLGDLPVGAYRELTGAEIKKLQSAGATRQPSTKRTKKSNRNRTPTGPGNDSKSGTAKKSARPVNKSASKKKSESRSSAGRTSTRKNAKTSSAKKPTGKKPTGKITAGKKPTGKKPAGKAAKVKRSSSRSSSDNKKMGFPSGTSRKSRKKSVSGKSSQRGGAKGNSRGTGKKAGPPKSRKKIASTKSRQRR